MPLAQMQVLKRAGDNGSTTVASTGVEKEKENSTKPDASPAVPSTPSKPPMNPLFAHLNTDDLDGTPRSSPAGSPGPEEGINTPQAGATSDGVGLSSGNGIEGPQLDIERIVPVMPLDQAIVTCINEGARGDERKMRDFFGGIMVIGGGSKTYNFNVYLEQRLRALQPNLAKEILVGPPPRELDPQVLVWKGGSVFGKLRGTNDSWIGQLEFDRLGARILNYKCMWNW